MRSNLVDLSPSYKLNLLAAAKAIQYLHRKFFPRGAFVSLCLSSLQRVQLLKSTTRYMVT